MSKWKLCILLLPMLSACATIDAFLFDAHPDGTPITHHDDPVVVSSNAELREAVRNEQAELEAIKAQKDAEQVVAAAEQVKEQLWVRVTFKPGQTAMAAQARRELSKVAMKFSGQNSKQHLAVRGYCDEEPIGGYDGKQRSAHRYSSQLALSQARADSVKEVLVKAGIPAAIISTAGYGATGFIADNATVEGRDKNRRVDIFLLAH